MKNIPDILFCEIASCLDAQSIFTLQETCKRNYTACEYARKTRKLFSNRIKSKIETLINKIEDDVFVSNFDSKLESNASVRAKHQAVIRLLRGEMQDVEMFIGGSFPLSAIDGGFAPNDINIFIKIPFFADAVKLDGLPEWSFGSARKSGCKLHQRPEIMYKFITTEYAVGSIFLFSENYSYQELDDHHTAYTRNMRGQVN